MCMQQQVHKTGVVTPTQQPKKTSENSECVSHPWKAMRSTVKSDQRQARPYHLVMWVGGQGRQDCTTTFQSKAQQASFHHLSWCAVEEEAQLLCSLSYTLSAELSCTSSLHFLLRRGKQEERFRKRRKRQKIFLILSTFAKEKTSN